MIYVWVTCAVDSINKGAVIIYGGGWHRREKGWVNKILSK